ncbi:MAG TPA: PilZ domain-containing protein [Acidimicrobiia bacterium]|jgi:c-di-GMP-binding flagellar brake protein YcgR
MFKRRGARAEGQPRFGDRRKAKRQSAGWEGRYRVVDLEREHLHYAGDDYEVCLLTDLSMEGAGLHLTEGEVTVGDHIELDLPLGDNKRASIQVRAEVRHATADDGAPRAGLEFIDVGDLERALLYRLLRDLNQNVSQSA